jgi:hypothetical protein
MHEYSRIVLFDDPFVVLLAVEFPNSLNPSDDSLKTPLSSNTSSYVEANPSSTSSRLPVLPGGDGDANDGARSDLVLEKRGGVVTGLIGLVLLFSGVGVSFRKGPPRLGMRGSNVHGERRGRAKNCLFFV